MTVEVKSEETQMAQVVASPQEEPAKVVAEKDPETKNQEEPKTGDREENKDRETEKESSSASPVIEKSSSFKEESNFLSDLKETEKKALVELKSKLEEAILENKLFKKEDKQKEDKENEKKPEKEGGEEDEGKAKIDEDVQEKPVKNDTEVSIWGVPLLPSKGSDSTNVVLLKFLRAREFKVNDAFEMLVKTLQWREESKISSILNEDLGMDFGRAAYMNGVDREGHPICYNVYGVFANSELYEKAFGTEENREKFLRWRFQLMENGIEKLNFEPEGVCSLLQITDLKNSPGISKKELRATMKKAVSLLQDNYPEFVARNIFINVPFWYYALNTLLSPFLTQRTKSKFVLVRPANVTETLLKYIPAENIPINYGGLERENDVEFLVEDGVSELIVKAGSMETIEIPVPEVDTTILWDLIVLGWEVNYKEEFVPTDEGSYTVIIQKSKKMGPQEEPVRNSFRNNEPGKVVVTIENAIFKKKKALFRYKTKANSS